MRVVVYTCIVMIMAILGALLGGFLHRYEVRQCDYLETQSNQDYYNYELKHDCYWINNYETANNIIAHSVIGLFSAFIGLMIVLFIESIGMY